MKINARELVVFGMLGALMYASKIALEALPNMHMLGVFTIAISVVYRKKALYPIYTYVFLNGLLSGFSPWWFPYLYIWTILWAATMLLPKNISSKYSTYIYMFLCGAHGFLFGILYAPANALMYGMSLNATMAWILAGLPFDIIHGISNFFVGILILPLIALLKRCEKYTNK